MGALTIGRIGLEVDLNHPAEWTETRSIDSREFVVRGFLKDGTSTAQTKYLRTELLEQQGSLIAVTYSLDEHFDGYYVLSQSRVESVPATYLRRGLIPYEVTLIRLGGWGRTEFQSNVTGTALENDHDLDEGDVRPFIAPPSGHAVFDWDVGGLVAQTRSTTDGNVTVFGCSSGGFVNDANWGVAPANYYKGSAKLYVNDLLRAGKDVPNDPADWVVTNGIVRIRPETSGGNNTGRLLFDLWGGSAWESEKDWKIYNSEVGELTTFDFFSVDRNDPECVTVRLAAEGGASSAKDSISIQLRRGSAFASVVYQRTRETTGTLQIIRDTNEAGTSFTPTGASGAVGLRATSNDAGGNRYVIMSPQSTTLHTTEGGLSVVDATIFKCAIGFEIGGSGADARNTAEYLGLQYHGFLSETVRGVWR